MHSACTFRRSQTGLTVLDVGCGTGRDVYVAAQLVGPAGRAIGLDMTAEQLEVAERTEEWHRERFGYPVVNTMFAHGDIENMRRAGIKDASVDVAISNCVVNLAADKEAVFREIWRVLKPGGELYFSDIYCDRRVPEAAQRDKASPQRGAAKAVTAERQRRRALRWLPPRRRVERDLDRSRSWPSLLQPLRSVQRAVRAVVQVLWGECLSGALYKGDFRRMMAAVGFKAYWTVRVASLKRAACIITACHTAAATAQRVHFVVSRAPLFRLMLSLRHCRSPRAW